jgi:hypothetical protein
MIKKTDNTMTKNRQYNEKKTDNTMTKKQTKQK